MKIQEVKFHLFIEDFFFFLNFAEKKKALKNIPVFYLHLSLSVKPKSCMGAAGNELDHKSEEKQTEAYHLRLWTSHLSPCVWRLCSWVSSFGEGDGTS